MKRRFWIPILAAALIIASVGSCFLLGAPGCANPTEEPAEPTGAHTSATVPLPNPYLSHFFLGARDKGDSRKLLGKVMLTFFLVSDSENRWDAGSVDTLRKTHEKATERMKAEAERYGVTLEVTRKYIPCTINGSMSRANYSYETCIVPALAAAGFSDPSKVSAALEKQFDVDDAAIIFCVNQAGGSFARMSYVPTGFEFAVVYGSRTDYRHELYHMYGAMDLYLGSVKAFAQSYLPTSVMLHASLGMMDGLTAYLIGWTDTLSAKATAFLEATKHISGSNYGY